MASQRTRKPSRKVVLAQSGNPVTSRRKESGVSTGTLLVVVALAVLILWLVMKNRGIGEYKNLEEWEIVRNEQGFATKIIVHRDAKQS